MRVSFSKFVVLNHFAYCETFTLNPVLCDLVDGVGYEAGVGAGYDACRVLGRLWETGVWFEFSVKEFIECFVSRKIGDEKFIQRDLILFNEVRLHKNGG